MGVHVVWRGPREKRGRNRIALIKAISVESPTVVCNKYKV